MIENEEEFDINPNYNRLKDFFMDFQGFFSFIKLKFNDFLY